MLRTPEAAVATVIEYDRLAIAPALSAAFTFTEENEPV
jgi:hypothetical protein